MIWKLGGPRQTAQVRAALVNLHLASPDDASAQCVAMGLSPLYAYKLAHERGLIPREGKYWGRLREAVHDSA
jgi:hypothetical protein